MRQTGQGKSRLPAAGLLLAGVTIASAPAFGGSSNRPIFSIQVPAAESGTDTLKWERVDVIPLPEPKGWRCEAKKIYSYEAIGIEQFVGTVRCVKSDSVVLFDVRCNEVTSPFEFKSIALGDSTGVNEITLICGFPIDTK